MSLSKVFLQKTQVVNNHAFFYISIILLTLNNKINDSLYQYLKIIITTFHSDNKTLLLNIIDKKHREEDDETQFDNLSEIGKAIFMNKNYTYKN